MRAAPSLLFALALVGLPACTASVSAPTPAPGAAQADATAAVKAANETYEKALMDGDAATLNRVLTEDFVFIGWEGELEGKAAFVRAATQEVDMTSCSANWRRPSSRSPASGRETPSPMASPSTRLNASPTSGSARPTAGGSRSSTPVP